jgi:DNA repair protein RadA/Sms
LTRVSQKTVYVCNSCGAEQAKWFGCCPDCGTWNTASEELQSPRRDLAPHPQVGVQSQPVPLTSAAAASATATPEDGSPSLDAAEARRLPTGFDELDRVLGGGLVPGAVVLVGGDPGIGKSTLLLQVVARMARAGHRALYVTGEESELQIRLRAERLAACDPHVLVVAETEMSRVCDHISEVEPEVVVADSIQTLYRNDLPSAPGTVTQVRECAFELIRVAKISNRPIFLVGHVTKEGDVAGPRVLEHMVDAVLYLEGERYQELRVLRAQKNRFGATTEIGLFEMVEDGLREVADPSGAFLSGRVTGVPGTAVCASLEGNRALLVEVQALVGNAVLPVPERQSTGLDRRRLAVLLAVLERRGRVGLGRRDVFVSVAGGLHLEETASDLPLLLAITSARAGEAVPEDLVVMGEVGLGGELRRVRGGARRLAEAARLGFTRAILPEANAADGRGVEIELLPASNLRAALVLALGEGALARVAPRPSDAGRQRGQNGKDRLSPSSGRRRG